MASPNAKTIGLIAGNGQFPFLFARAARDQQFSVVAAAVTGDTSPFLYFFVDKFRYFKVGQLKKLFEYFRAYAVSQVIMAGQVSQDNLFNPAVKLDEELQALHDALRDRKADTIFTAVADRLKKEGMVLVDSTFLLKKYLAPQGTLTKRGPTESELKDIEFGLCLAKQMGGIDIGQTVVVKEKAIVAIEAMEGTDRAIARGGAIARQGAVVVKTSKPAQDSRFDVPVIGPRTIQAMARTKAACLAIEAGKTLIIDYDKTVQLANQADICLVAA
ncbi:MAG: UDP-2,3-diacylglucosamine diphosphatase LpxI [Candidatus Omnitrophica bacterium]|nr:UDP-2,3-diacylglucosamine diphosphatase LpxI [Candidatus Omnitrophota bacterium]MDE2222673.1 UDP-2,3-diacylglucosamine diphosphatase LpxI [Candidatus Omnitrophota bacterium]